MQGIGAGGIGIPERHRLGNPPRRELGGVFGARLPGPVRRLVVHHQEERLVPGPLLDELDGEIGDDVGRVAACIRLLARRRVEHRVPVGALAGQDLPAIEADGIAAEMPFADHAGVIARLLQQARDRHARAVEAVEDGNAVEVRVLPGQDRGAAGRADRVRREHPRQQRALPRQPIEVGRRVHPRPVRANRMRRVVVGHDEHDVRPSAGLRGHDGRHEQQRRGQRPRTQRHSAVRAPDIEHLHHAGFSTLRNRSRAAARFSRPTAMPVRTTGGPSETIHHAGRPAWTSMATSIRPSDTFITAM